MSDDLEKILPFGQNGHWGDIHKSFNKLPIGIKAKTSFINLLKKYTANSQIEPTESLLTCGYLGQFNGLPFYEDNSIEHEYELIYEED